MEDWHSVQSTNCFIPEGIHSHWSDEPADEHTLSVHGYRWFINTKCVLTRALCAFDFVRRAYLHMDLQRVPIVRHPGHTAICVPEDGQPVHRQSRTFWCGQLHLCC